MIGEKSSSTVMDILVILHHNEHQKANVMLLFGLFSIKKNEIIIKENQRKIDSVSSSMRASLDHGRIVFTAVIGPFILGQNRGFS